MGSSFLDEQVIRVPGMCKADLEALGEAFLAEFAPDCLQEPTSLDLLKLIDYDLPRHNIHVSPASAEELEDREAATDPEGSKDIEVLVLDDHWHALRRGGPRANFARTTVAHELSHAILHVPVIRRRQKLPSHQHLLSRHRRGDLKPWEDPEWQAWMLAGAILIPRCTLSTVAGRWSPATIAQVYGVSEVMLRKHAGRLNVEL